MIIRNVDDLGLIVRDQRKQQGLTQEKLAQKVGVAKLWISNFERGKATSHVGLVIRTLNALELTISISPPAIDQPIDLNALIDASIDNE